MTLHLWVPLHSDPAASSPPSVDDGGKANAGAAETSAEKYSRRCDPLSIRRKFPHQWSGFLRAHFRDAVEVAYVFSVDAKTARHWWEGTTGPQGWAVEFVHQVFPDAAKWMEAA